MCYHHIVIATDLSDDGKRLVEKGALLAEALKAKLSLIYVDVHYDTYHAAIGFSERSEDGVPFEEKIRKELEPTTQNVNYPIAEVIIGRGGFVDDCARRSWIKTSICWCSAITTICGAICFLPPATPSTS